MNRLKEKAGQASRVLRKKLFKTKKGWMVAGIATMSLMGTALVAPQGTAHAALIDVSVGQTTHSDNATTTDQQTPTVEQNQATNQQSTDQTNGQSNLNKDGAVSADNVDDTSNQRNVTLVGQKDDGIAANVGGSANQQVVTEVPKDVQDKVSLGKYDDRQNVTDPKNGNWTSNENYQKPVVDQQNNYVPTGNQGQAKVTVTMNAPENQQKLTQVSNQIQANNVKMINAIKSVQDAMNSAVSTIANPGGATLNAIKSALSSVGIKIGGLETLPTINASFNLGDVNTPGTVTGELAAAMKDLTPEQLLRVTKLVNTKLVTNNGKQYIVTDDFSGSIGDGVKQSMNGFVDKTVNAFDKINFTYTPLSVPELKWAGDIGKTVNLAYTTSAYGLINAMAKSVQEFVNADNDQVSLKVDISQITAQNNKILGSIPFVGGFIAQQMNNILQNLANVAFHPLQTAGYAMDSLLNQSRRSLQAIIDGSGFVMNLIGSVSRGTTKIEIPMVVTNPDLSRFAGGTKVAERFGLVFTKDNNFVEAAANQAPFDTTSVVYEVVNKTRDNGANAAAYQSKGQTNPDGLKAEIALSQQLVSQSISTTGTVTELKAALVKAQAVYNDINATQTDVDQAEETLEKLNLALLPQGDAQVNQLEKNDHTINTNKGEDGSFDHTTEDGLVVADNDFNSLKPTASDKSTFAPENDYTVQELNNFKALFADRISHMISTLPDNSDSKYIEGVQSALNSLGMTPEFNATFMNAMKDKTFWTNFIAQPLKTTSDLASSLGAKVDSKFLTGLYNAVNPAIVSILGTPLYDQPQDTKWSDLRLDDGSMPMNMNVDQMMMKKMSNLHWEKATDLSENRRVVFDLSKLNLGLTGNVTLPDNYSGNVLGNLMDPNYVAPHPDQVLADLLSWLTGQPINGLPIDGNTGYLVGFLYNHGLTGASGTTFPTLNAMLGAFVAGLSGNTVERTLGMMDERLKTDGGNTLVTAMATLGDTTRQLMRFDFPDVLNWIHDGVFQFINSASANSTAGGPSASNTDAPNTAEYNKLFMNNKEMGEMDMYLLSAISVNNFANFIIKSATALVGSVVGIGTSAVNGYMHPGEQTPAGADAMKTQLARLGGTTVNSITDALGALIDGAIRTIIGEIEYPILSDEPDRLVFGTLAAVVTGVNSGIHDILGMVDSAGASANIAVNDALTAITRLGKSPEVISEAVKAVQNNDTTTFHRLMGATSSVVDASTDLVWDVIASVLNITQLVHPHGFSNLA